LADRKIPHNLLKRLNPRKEKPFAFLPPGFVFVAPGFAFVAGGFAFVASTIRERRVK
jgi:hypothetical protein